MALDPSQAMGFYQPQGDDMLSQLHMMATNPEMFAELMARQGVPPPDPAALTQVAGMAGAGMPTAAPMGAPAQPNPMDNPNAPHNLIRKMFGLEPPAPPSPMGTDAGYPQEPRGMLPSAGAPVGAPNPVPDQGKPTPTTRDGAPPKEVMGTQGTKLAEGTVPVPRPRPAAAAMAPGGEAAPAQKDLLGLLSGVKAPGSPTVQKISTPSVPATKGVSTAEAEMLLKQMLGMVTGGANMLRLGQALGGR